MAKQRFESQAIPSLQQNNNVDTENGIIKNVVIIQEGIDKENQYFDNKFLEDLIEFANAQKQGVKSRFGHPNIFGTTLGTYLGKYKNFRLIKDEKNKVIADLYLAPIAKKTQVKGQGISMWDYILEMATDNPDMFGNSIHFTGELKSKKIDDKQVDTYIFKTLYGSDLVDLPAATDSLFKDVDDFGLTVTTFLNQNPQIFELIKKDTTVIQTFFKHYIEYLTLKNSKPMSIFNNILKSLGVTKALDLTLADGRIIKVETDDEKPKVGNPVTDEEGNKLQDGEHLLPDGRKIVVADGKISEIKEAEPTKPTENETQQELKALKEAVVLLTGELEAVAKNYKTLDEKYTTLARSVTSRDYNPPNPEPTPMTKNKGEKDLFTIVQEQEQKQK